MTWPVEVLWSSLHIKDTSLYGGTRVIKADSLLSIDTRATIYPSCGSETLETIYGKSATNRECKFCSQFAAERENKSRGYNSCTQTLTPP